MLISTPQSNPHNQQLTYPEGFIHLSATSHWHLQQFVLRQNAAASRGLVIKQKLSFQALFFFNLTKGWKEWGDENITDTSESVLKMFSFWRENVLRPHCPQCVFHCLETPWVSLSYFWLLLTWRVPSCSLKVSCCFNKHWSLSIHTLSVHTPT